MYKIFFVFYLFMLSAIAKEWINITPLPHCEKFQIEYSFDGKYQVRYKASPNQEYEYSPKKIENINDLSNLTDELVDASYSYCPLNIVLTEIEDTYICAPEKLSTKPFSKDYTSLLGNIINVIDKAGKNCDDVIPLIELQNKIGQLNQNQILKFNNYKSFFKYVTPDKTDKMIDHYYECGRASEKFVENLILLEAKNACLFPSPPGKLKLKKVKDIAKKVAKNFPGLSLMGLNNKKDLITKMAITEFVDAVLIDQVTKLLGDTVDPKTFVKTLKVSKDMKKVRPKNALDYTTHILSVDAPLEIIDKGLPYIIKNNFMSMLPSNLSEKEKDQFIKNKIVPVIKKDYDSCIKETKETLEYPFSGNVSKRYQSKPRTYNRNSKRKKKIKYTTTKELKKILAHRKSLAENFCDKNEKECQKQGCGKKQNYSTTRSDITDMNIIQSCLFKGLTHSIKPILHKIVEMQQESFKDKFNMSDKLVNHLSKKAYDEIYQCADKKVKDATNIHDQEDFTKNLEALLHIDTEGFKKALVSCAKNIEVDLTKTMANLLISNMKIVKETFGNDQETRFYDQNLNKGAYQFAKKMSSKAVDACLKNQLKRVTKNKMSAISCRPMVEMQVGSVIIKQSLINTLKDSKVNKSSSEVIVDKFNTCSEKAISSGNNAVFNKQHSTPILSPTDANSFLTNNNEFYTCVDKAIKETVNLVTDKTLDRIKNVNKDKIKDMDYFKSLLPQTKLDVVACFNEGMKEIGSWPNFLKFNERKGLDDLKKKCTERATYFVLPKVIANETKLKLKFINKSNLVNFDLEKVSLELNKAYDLKLALDHKFSTEEVIAKAYGKFQKSNPTLSLNAFVSDLTNKIQLKVITSIKENILSPVLNSEFEFNDFDKTLTSSCLNTIYKANIKNLEKIIKISKENPLKDGRKIELKKMLIDLIKDGLITAKKMNRYPIFINGLKKVCKSPEKYKDMMDIAHLGIADDIILNQIAIKVRKSFKEVAKNACHDELRKQKIKFNLDVTDEIKKKLCSTENLTDKEFEDLKWNLLVKFNNLNHRALVEFILERKNSTLKLIDSDLGLDFINELYYNDKALLNSIYDNFTGVIGRDPKVVEKITIIAVNKMFQNKEKGSFASKFIEFQLVGAIGIQGLEKANRKVATKLSKLGTLEGVFKKEVYPKAYTEYYKRWNSNGVKHYLNWNNLSQTKREELMNSVIKRKILTRFDSELKEDTAKLELLDEEIKIQIIDHVTNHKNFKNPYYKTDLERRVLNNKMGTYYTVKSNENPYLSFNEMLAKDIRKSTSSGIINDYKKKLKYIKEKVKDVFTSGP